MKTIKFSKKYKMSVLWIILIIFSISCNESYFDIYPTDNMTEGSFYKTEADFQKAVDTSYEALRSLYSAVVMLAELPTDISFSRTTSADYQQLSQSWVDSENGTVSSAWSNSYTAIARANIVINNLEEGDISFDKKNRFIAEAKFIRALVYFNMVRLWGDVPLVLKEVKTYDEAFSFLRTPVSDIYSQILSDIEFAINNLPLQYTDIDKGRASKWAALSLQGEVYLTLNDFEKAKLSLEQVIKNSHHKLLNDYQSIFEGVNSNNEEIVFAIQFARGFDPAIGNPFTTRAWPNEILSYKGIYRMGGGGMSMTHQFYHKWDKSDLRFQTMVDSLPTPDTYIFEPYYFVNYKHFDSRITLEAIDSGNDLNLYRYAGVKLMYAEALNETEDINGAFKQLQDVRTRAGLSTSDDIKSGKDLMKLALEDEKLFELCYEGHRWFDLKRTGRLQTVMNNFYKGEGSSYEVGDGTVTVEDYELLLPIPNSEILLIDDLIQNPGY